LPFRCFPRQWANSANCQKRADPHPRNRSRCSLLAAASSSSASSSAIGEESVQGRLHLLVSGALPAAKARYRPDSPRCSRAALFVWTAHPLARLTPCLETPMTHVEVHACPLSGLDPLMFSEVGPALLRKASRSSTSSRSSTRSSLVDILLSASSSCARPSFAAGRMGRAQRARPLRTWTLLCCCVLRALWRCKTGHVASSGLLPMYPHPQQSVTVSSGGTLGPICAPLELCCAGLRLAVP